MAIGFFSILLCLLGFFGGKLVALEAAAISQLTFYSLLSLNDMSPSYAALTKLAISNGYNQIKSYDMGVNNPMSKNIKGVSLEGEFIYNYNFMALMVFLPFLIALVTKFMIKF